MKVHTLTYSHLQDFINDIFIFIFGNRKEEVYCSESVNATADTEDFDKCLTRVQEKERDKAAKETWMSIMIGLAIFFFVFICK